MTPDKWMDLWYRSAVYESLFAIMPPDFPKLRELRIQNQKLQRLLEGVYDEDGPWRILAGGGNILRKNEGVRSARAGAQARKLQEMVVRSFKEWIRSDFQRRNQKFTNKTFRDWRISWDKAMKKGVVQMKEKVAAALAEKKQAGALPPAK